MALFQNFRRRIKEAGYYTVVDKHLAIPRVILASKKRRGGGYCGFSFWIMLIEERYYLGTWCPRLYLLDSSVDPVTQCLECLNNPTGTWKIADRIVKKLRMRQITEKRFLTLQERAARRISEDQS